MTLRADQFIRSFLLHVVPAGVQPSRHFFSRKLLDVSCLDLLPSAVQTRQALKEIVEAAATCPGCTVGKMLNVMKLPPIPWPARPP